MTHSFNQLLFFSRFVAVEMLYILQKVLVITSVTDVDAELSVFILKRLR